MVAIYRMMNAFMHGSRNKSSIKNLQATAMMNRSEIDSKFKEVCDTDTQLNLLLSETKNLSEVVQKKFKTKLRITSNTLKTICHYLKDGIILLDYRGHVIDTNEAFKKNIYGDANIVGHDIEDIMNLLGAENNNGDRFQITSAFFENLSSNIFTNVSNHSISKDQVFDYFKKISTFNTDTKLSIQPLTKKHPVRVSMTLTILDNTPESLKDITYIIILNNSRRSTDGQNSYSRTPRIQYGLE